MQSIRAKNTITDDLKKHSSGKSLLLSTPEGKTPMN